MEQNTIAKFKIFQTDQFGKLRVFQVNGDPWFAAVDVCEALGLANPTVALARLDSDEKMTLSSIEGHSGQRGGAQQLNVVSESGLYSLVLSSKKPAAHAFKRWITHEVIPSIRKYGIYMTDSLLDQVVYEPDLIHRLAEKLESEREQRIDLQNQLRIAAPKARYVQGCVTPFDCTNIRTTAKELNVPERKFTAYLNKKGYMYRGPLGNLLPYLKESNNGLFIVHNFYYGYHNEGCYTLITPLGKDHFRKLAEEIREFRK